MPKPPASDGKDFDNPLKELSTKELENLFTKVLSDHLKEPYAAEVSGVTYAFESAKLTLTLSRDRQSIQQWHLAALKENMAKDPEGTV